MKTILILAAAALGGLTAAPALAQNSVAISYADLNLDSDAGTTTMTHRIRNAADRVCGGVPGQTDLASHMAVQKCRKEAVDTAMKALEARRTPQFAAR